MPRHVNLRTCVTVINKRRRDSSLFDAIISTVEIDVRIPAPKSIAHREKLLSPRVALVVRKKIPITMLLFRRTSCHDVESNTTLDQRRSSVHLLHKRCRLHQPRSIRDDELELLDRLAQRTSHQKRIRLVTAERDQYLLDARGFRVSRKVRPAREVRFRRGRRSRHRLDAITRCLERRLPSVDLYFAAFRQHPVKPQRHSLLSQYAAVLPLALHRRMDLRA